MAGNRFIPIIAVAALAALFSLERMAPLRSRRMPLRPRLARNVAMGTSSMLVVTLVQRPILDWLTATVERRRLGLAQQLPPALRGPAAFLLLDYLIYRWHILTHRVPLLWGLHRLHHDDRDMTATTAMRFSAVDMLVSMPWRLGMVLVAGASPSAHRAWDGFFMASVLLHHANLRLPYDLERRLVRVFTTPRLHGIHHNADAADQDHNFSSGLSLWDWLHGTARFDDRDAAVKIGLPAALGTPQ